MSRINSSLSVTIATLISALTLTACGGGGGSNGASGNPGGTASTPPPPTSSSTAPGVWKGTITSTTTGQASTVLGMTGNNGQSFWMTPDGRVWNGQMPLTGTQFNTTMTGYMYPGSHFPDGSNFGPSSMMFDYSGGMWSGQYSGVGDAGTFSMGLSSMWNRPASLGTVAGTYTRSVSYGYTMTMTIDSNGVLSAADSRGCLIGGTVTVFDPSHNQYQIAATVTSCGTLNGAYSGMGTLVDADYMHDWLTTMKPFDCGWYSVGGWTGGGMMGGGMMGNWRPPVGQNVIPGGSNNLFMFSFVNDHNAIMDALAR